MAKKKALNRGLDEIFGQNVNSLLDEIVKGDTGIATSKSELLIKDIRPNPYQPRKDFDEEGLNELGLTLKDGVPAWIETEAPAEEPEETEQP